MHGTSFCEWHLYHKKPFVFGFTSIALSGQPHGAIKWPLEREMNMQIRWCSPWSLLSIELQLKLIVHLRKKNKLCVYAANELKTIATLSILNLIYPCCGQSKCIRGKPLCKIRSFRYHSHFESIIRLKANTLLVQRIKCIVMCAFDSIKLNTFRKWAP